MARSWLIIPLFLLYLYHLGGVGFIAPDEPRYAWVSREMAHPGSFSGLVTPYLYGKPWFEKPPLLYWMTALATRLGLRDEWAARVPVALASIAFLILFYRTLARELSGSIAVYATTILATSAGWLAYSFEAVTDLPMAVSLGTAILLALTGEKSQKRGAGAGVFLGLAVLAKALVPLVLFAPIWLMARGRRIGIVIGAAIVAVPWYATETALYGNDFLRELIWKQHFARFLNPSLQHVKPFWYYVPVILLGLFPWTLTPVLLFSRRIWTDPRAQFVGAWCLYTLLFFSIAQNKLPGYVLPVMPALAVLLALALENANGREIWLAASVLLLAALPPIVRALPEALLEGARHAKFTPGLGWPFIALAVLVFFLRKPNVAMILAGLCAAAGVLYVKQSSFPVLDQRVSARQFFREHASQIPDACFDPGVVRRAWQYGLNYYADRALPECSSQSSKPRVTVRDGQLNMQQ